MNLNALEKQACTDSLTPRHQNKSSRGEPHLRVQQPGQLHAPEKDSNHGATTFSPCCGLTVPQPLRQSACKQALQSPSTFLLDPNHLTGPARISCFHHFLCCLSRGGTGAVLIPEQGQEHTGSPGGRKPASTLP